MKSIHNPRIFFKPLATLLFLSIWILLERHILILILTGLPLYIETWKNLDFDNLGKKNLEFKKFWKKNLKFLTKITKNLGKTRKLSRKILMMTNNFKNRIELLFQIEILLLYMNKLLKILGFFRFFFQIFLNFRFFQVK